MISFRLGLNRGSSNYSFFDPESGVSLSIGNPVGFADRITPMILRGLRYKTILDLDDVIDLKAGSFKTAQENKELTPPANTEVPPVTPPVTDPNGEPPKSDASEASTPTEELQAPEVPVNTEAPADVTPEAPVEEAKVETPVEDKAVNKGEDNKTTAKNTKKK